MKRLVIPPHDVGDMPALRTALISLDYAIFVWPFAEDFRAHDPVSRDDSAERADAWMRPALSDALDCLLSLDNASKHRVVAVHVRLRSECDEELASSAIGLVKVDHAEGAAEMAAGARALELVG